MNAAIGRAIQAFGSQAAMASALNVKQPTVSEWLRGDRQVPAERCPQIEQETHRLGTPILCEGLRPDVRWVRVPDQDWPNGKPLIDKTPATEHAEPCEEQPSPALLLVGDRRADAEGDRDHPNAKRSTDARSYAAIARKVLAIKARARRDGPSGRER